jgi:hypothetical protein
MSNKPGSRQREAPLTSRRLDSENTSSRGQLSDGARNYLVFTLIFSACSGLFYTTGWVEVTHDDFDQTMRVLTVMFPIIGVVFLAILSNE